MVQKSHLVYKLSYIPKQEIFEETQFWLHLLPPLLGTKNIFSQLFNGCTIKEWSDSAMMKKVKPQKGKSPRNLFVDTKPLTKLLNFNQHSEKLW